MDMLIGAGFLRTHDCQIMYQASGRDVFGIKDGECEKGIRNNQKLKTEHDSQFHATPKRTPAKLRDHSSLALL